MVFQGILLAAASIILPASIMLSTNLAAQHTSIDKILAQLAPPPADEALDQIPDLGRKLLALRSYLRAGSCLKERWSWSEQEIKAFQGSVEQSSLLDEVAAVSAHFARSNPEYQIYANTRVRSLGAQIARWNESASVGSAAQEILVAWKTKFDDNARLKEAVDPIELRSWLSGLALTKQASLAAPGLSLHGRAHAIDFQILKDGIIIGGADKTKIETFWRAEKWDQKLKASIDAAGPSFKGPLTSPDEPWHYNYEPPHAAARSC